MTNRIVTVKRNGVPFRTFKTMPRAWQFVRDWLIVHPRDSLSVI